MDFAHYLIQFREWLKKIKRVDILRGAADILCGFTFSCFLIPIWPETSGLALPVYYQQSDMPKLMPSILSFRVE